MYPTVFNRIRIKVSGILEDIRRELVHSESAVEILKQPMRGNLKGKTEPVVPIEELEETMKKDVPRTATENQDVTLKIDPNIMMSRRAEFSIKSLISIGVTDVLESVNKLAQFQKEKTLPPQVEQLDIPGNIYVLRSLGDLRIIFRICDNRIEILDLVRRNNLDSMFGRDRLAEG